MGINESIDANEMGDDNEISGQLMNEFEANTQFTPQELQQLFLVYRKIGGRSTNGGDGVINKDEFIKEISFCNEEIGELMFSMIDVDKDRKVTFKEFVYGLNTFHPNNPNIDEKIQKCFQAYDEDHGGSISQNEVRQIINMSLDGNIFLELDEAHMQQLLDDLFAKYDTSGDPLGSMSLTDFKSMVLKAPGILDSFEFDTSMLPPLSELKGGE